MSTSLPRLLAAAFALFFVVAACAGDTGAQWTFSPVAVGEDAAADDAFEVGDDVVPVEQGDELPPGPLGPEVPGQEPDPGNEIGTLPEGVEAGEVDPDVPIGDDPVVDEGAAEDFPVELTDPVGTQPPVVGSAAPATDGAQGDAGTSGEPRVVEMEATADLRFKQNGEVLADIPVTPGQTVVFRIDNTAGFDHNFYIGTDEQLQVPSGTTDVGIPTWQSGVQEVTWQVPQDISGLKFGCTVPGHYAAGMQGTFSVAA